MPKPELFFVGGPAWDGLALISSTFFVHMYIISCVTSTKKNSNLEISFDF